MRILKYMRQPSLDWVGIGKGRFRSSGEKMKSFRDLIRIAFIACWTGYLGNASGDQDALHLKNDAQARFKHATALAQQGQDDEAIALFDALIAQYPELPEPYNNLAALHAKYGRLDAARAALESALAVHSDYALAYQNLGRVYLQLAERAYQRTLELEPRNASAKRMQNAFNLFWRLPLKVAERPWTKTYEDRAAWRATSALSIPGGYQRPEAYQI